jgi:hypothetical protein
MGAKTRKGDPASAAPSREKPQDYVSGQVSWLPGQRLASDLPRITPSGGAAVGAFGSGLAGYSGGTAQAFDLLPFSPLAVRGTLTLPWQCDSTVDEMSTV